MRHTCTRNNNGIAMLHRRYAVVIRSKNPNDNGKVKVEQYTCPADMTDHEWRNNCIATQNRFGYRVILICFLGYGDPCKVYPPS
jgi:hypothetical protein